MNLEEKLKSLKMKDRVQAEMIEDRFGLVFPGTFMMYDGHWINMVGDDGKHINIQREFLKDINKV